MLKNDISIVSTMQKKIVIFQDPDGNKLMAIQMD